MVQAGQEEWMVKERRIAGPPAHYSSGESLCCQPMDCTKTNLAFQPSLHHSSSRAADRRLTISLLNRLQSIPRTIACRVLVCCFQPLVVCRCTSHAATVSFCLGSQF